MVLVFLMGSGCDFTSNSEISEPEQHFTVKNDVMSRVTFFDNAAKEATNIPSASSNATDYLELIAQVDPPDISNGPARASHLFFDGSNSIFVGYKVQGEKYGGGIDILTSGNGSSVAEARAFEANVFDVQEVIYDKYEEVMFVAGASKQKGSLVLKMNPDNANVLASATINGHVAKSLDISYHNNASKSKLYVVSDLNDLYRFNKDLTLTENGHLKAAEGVEFRSVGARDNSQIFTLDLRGNVHRTNPSYNGFRNTLQLTSNSEFKSNLAIGRISYFNESTPDNILVATNQYGFGVLNPSGQVAWSSSEENLDEIKARYYTALTGFEPDGPPGQDDAIIYASGVGANGEPVIDILGFPNNKRMYHIATLDLSEFNGVGNAQINHVYATGQYLYVAKGIDGVLIFEIK